MDLSTFPHPGDPTTLPCSAQPWQRGGKGGFLRASSYSSRD